jgi:hypothetical protein
MSSPDFNPARRDSVDVHVTLNRSWAQAVGDATGAVITGESTNPGQSLGEQPERPEGDMPKIRVNNNDIVRDTHELNEKGCAGAAAANAGANALNEFLNGMSTIEVYCRRTPGGQPYIRIIANPSLGNQRPLSEEEVGPVIWNWLERGLKTQRKE